jgi:hypothetical protein
VRRCSSTRGQAPVERQHVACKRSPAPPRQHRGTLSHLFGTVCDAYAAAQTRLYGLHARLTVKLAQHLAAAQLVQLRGGSRCVRQRCRATLPARGPHLVAQQRQRLGGTCELVVEIADAVQPERLWDQAGRRICSARVSYHRARQGVQGAAGAADRWPRSRAGTSDRAAPTSRAPARRAAAGRAAQRRRGVAWRGVAWRGVAWRGVA